MRQNKILSLSADLERVMRELEAIMREALLSSNGPDENIHSFTKRMRELLIQITHLKEDLAFYQRQRRIRQGMLFGLALMSGCLATSFKTPLSEDYRFFRNKEHEYRKKLRDLELELKLAILEIADVENTDKPPW